MNPSLLYIALAFALAVAGGGLAGSLGRSQARLSVLISFGAGTLLGVTAFAILPEVMAELRWWALILAFGSGYLLFFLITRYVSHVCPACAASHFDQNATHRFAEIARAMMLALSIHCAADGIAIAAGNEEELTRAAGSHALGLSVVVAVCIHKVPEGLALGSLLLGAGFRPGPMLLRVAGVEATTILGGILGLLCLRHFPEAWVAALVAHAGGGFLFLAINAITGESFKHQKGLMRLNFGAGCGLIGFVTIASRFL